MEKNYTTQFLKEVISNEETEVAKSITTSFFDDDDDDDWDDDDDDD